MKVRVVAYKNKIVIDPIEPEKGIGDGWHPMGRGGHTGCVLLDTKQHLGVSEEALALLAMVRPSQDAVGDISWWAGDSFGFSWLGSVQRVLDPEKCEGSIDFEITDLHRLHCTIISNEVPEAAQRAIDQNPDANTWSETEPDHQPQRFDYEIRACVLIDRPVINYLMEASRHHYDAHCKSIGRDGFLLGWHNQLAWQEVQGKTTLMVTATFRELDTLAKLSEIHSPHADLGVYYAIKTILDGINTEVRNLRELGIPQWNKEPFTLVGKVS